MVARDKAEVQTRADREIEQLDRTYGGGQPYDREPPRLRRPPPRKPRYHGDGGGRQAADPAEPKEHGEFD